MAAQTEKPENSEEKKTSNDDLKKLIESLKKKIGTADAVQEKKAPPAKRAGTWNRSASKWTPDPAYSVLTRISNHEKVPTKKNKQDEHTIKQLPHSFLYKPGADGIKIDNVEVKAGKQIGWG